ncbi:MAG: aminotransferase class I/II-fold pyridoxal phosphate-dependent enzyme [Candidatus Dadabacteria bacterium]|nr:MAG: aminotransferase class I/II-fold pyridoxal phosphate-dependent enzyme [Candidatus Dadabacteria bacterium]
MESTDRISPKLGKFRPSLTLGLKAIANERKSKGLPVYDFGLGETKGNLNPVVKEAGIQAFKDEMTMYADPAGMPELRDAVLDWLALKEHYTIENVTITAGAKQALFNMIMAICNPGDVVLFDAAPWVSYAPLAYCAYAVPVMVLSLEKKDNYLKVTPEDLRRNLELRPFSKLFLLNSPCNPTGQLYTAEEVEALLRVCIEHKIFFALDRLYWKILFDGRSYPEPRIDQETKPWVIQVDGMSKNFRRCGGLRIGWCVAPDDVSRAMINLQSHYTSGPTTVSQQAALAAITSDYDTELATDLENKRNLMQKHCKDIPCVKVFPTDGSFYSFWDVREAFGKKTPSGEILKNSDDVANYLTRDYGVLTGSGMGFLQNGYLRLCFATPDETIIEGMAQARKAFESLK